MNPRDTIAEMLGWEPYSIRGPDAWMWYPDNSDTPWISETHPIHNSIDFISRAWPDICVWWKEEDFDVWACRHYHCGKVASLPITDDELADRMALYAKVLKWLRDHDRLAFEAAIAKARRVMEEVR